MVDAEQHITFAKSLGFRPINSIIINNLDFLNDDGMYIAPISKKELSEHYMTENVIWWDYENKNHYNCAKDICEFFWDEYESFCFESGLKVI